jgi:hypothetical protein
MTMTDAFHPKFEDMVRNFTLTTGTADFELSDPVNGFADLRTAILPGEQFYYACIGVDDPREREVGRGTMAEGGTVIRDPVGGAQRTHFSLGAKVIGIVSHSRHPWPDK